MIFVSIVLLLAYVESYQKSAASFRYSSSYNLQKASIIVRYTAPPSGNKGDRNLEILDLIETQPNSPSSDLHLERTDQNKPRRLLSKDWELPNAIKDIRCYLTGFRKLNK
jgi:hypothetical protein